MVLGEWGLSRPDGISFPPQLPTDPRRLRGLTRRPPAHAGSHQEQEQEPIFFYLIKKKIKSILFH